MVSDICRDFQNLQSLVITHCIDRVSLGSDRLVEQEKYYACSLSSGSSRKGSLSLKVRERSEDSKRESELSVKGHRKPENRKMKESEACKEGHESYGELVRWEQD